VELIHVRGIITAYLFNSTYNPYLVERQPRNNNMCRILVISDIHGNLEDLLYLTGRSNRREYQFLKEEFDRVFLLGDYIGDNPTYCTVAQGDSVLEFIKDYLIDNERQYHSTWKPRAMRN
jgi:hypothetical protein